MPPSGGRRGPQDEGSSSSSQRSLVDFCFCANSALSWLPSTQRGRLDRFQATPSPYQKLTPLDGDARLSASVHSHSGQVPQMHLQPLGNAISIKNPPPHYCLTLMVT